MTLNKQVIIDRTIKATNLLPTDKAEEISDFADFVSKRYEEQQLTQGIQKLAAESQAFSVFARGRRTVHGSRPKGSTY